MTQPNPGEDEEQRNREVDEIVRRGPSGAFAVAGVATAIVVVIYLAFYFFGGLAGAAILGQLFDRYGWTACVAGIGVSLLVAAVLALFLETPLEPEAIKHKIHHA